jgi:hypothetical protein
MARRFLNSTLSLYGPLPPLQSSVFSLAHGLSTALCHLCGHLSPFRILCPLYGPISPLWSHVPLRSSATSIALYPFYGPLPCLQPFALSTALYPLYCPLSPLQPFYYSLALCSL